ncbi:MAG TPA: PLDc N-terminal domain-containing protein [Candidatus Limnocylindrales bacterium]|nr:PLDc N-terminal domain-containing protein [Candidatus Limnocylindrales bacterium]
MPTERAAEPASALAGLAVLLVVLAIHLVLARRAVRDLARDDVRARNASKQTWFIVIVLAAIVGPIAWFQVGREDLR